MVNIFRVLVMRILTWLYENADPPVRIDTREYINVIHNETIRRSCIPDNPTDYNKWMCDVIKNRDVCTLDRCISMENVGSIVGYSYSGCPGRVPAWMYQFLMYKSVKWNVPMCSWIIDMIENTHNSSETVMQILTSLCTYASLSSSVRSLARKLTLKYRDVLSTSDRNRLYLLSQKTVYV